MKKQISPDLLYGRQLVVNKNYPEYDLPAQVKREEAILQGSCQRCGQKIPQWAYLPTGTYCWSCHMLGRLTSNDQLVTLAECNQFTVTENFLDGKAV
ncbi:hypothetical protein [Weissella halotolerans]|uniref:Uncharacterized protein n=1 Tax=Weissella halotolerans DSM 20190 TaxID=1123500 RepID=A0A0R2FQI7_9LACO|nr:hypothetical protein [Weissella halotolerans]KRN30771.1 hypothetical protein IV68_GL001197 [Weissella halotolerans DSM 20190]